MNAICRACIKDHFSDCWKDKDLHLVKYCKILRAVLKAISYGACGVPLTSVSNLTNSIKRDIDKAKGAV